MFLFVFLIARFPNPCHAALCLIIDGFVLSFVNSQCTIIDNVGHVFFDTHLSSHTVLFLLIVSSRRERKTVSSASLSQRTGAKILRFEFFLSQR